jgi:hypothetical protein
MSITTRIASYERFQSIKNTNPKELPQIKRTADLQSAPEPKPHPARQSLSRDHRIQRAIVNFPENHHCKFPGKSL